MGYLNYEEIKILIHNKSVDALIVVDVQKGFVLGNEAVPASEQLLSSIHILISKARLAKAPIIFLQNDGDIGAVDEPFQLGWELFFQPQEGEIVLRKSNDDGFDDTPLQQILNEYRTRSFAICGLLSEMCVAATARAGLELGYGVLLPHDAHATYNVPAGPGSQEVPAAMAARAAEWSLGDEIIICASSHEVNFIESNK